MDTSAAEIQSTNEIYVYMDKKFAELELKISGQFVDDIKTKITQEFAVLLENQNKKIERLESTVAVLQQHVHTLKQQTENLTTNYDRTNDVCDELEQYGRRVCLRIDGMPTENGEKSNDVLEKVKRVWVDAGVVIPEAAIDRAHRIGPSYLDRDTGVQMKSVIVRLTTFRHRSMIYHARKDIKKRANLKVKLDLTRHRYKLLQDAMNMVADKKEIVKFVYADINCRLKVKFIDESEIVFNSLEHLENLISG